VDKLDFFHKLKGLRAPKAVGQTLFLPRTKTGKKIRGRVSWQFRTFDPVDIQQLIHKRLGNREFGGGGSRRGRRRADVVVTNASGVGRFFLACGTTSRDVEVEDEKNFFLAGPRLSRRVVRFTTKSLYTE
jgi:hypothetical protein